MLSMIPPKKNTQKLKALIRGKATSRAPTWSGIRKLANAAPIGITTRKTITVPCMVKTRL